MHTVAGRNTGHFPTGISIRDRFPDGMRSSQLIRGMAIIGTERNSADVQQVVIFGTMRIMAGITFQMPVRFTVPELTRLNMAFPTGDRVGNNHYSITILEYCRLMAKDTFRTAFIKMLDLLLQNIRMAVKAILIVDMKMDPMTVTANQGGNRQDQSKNAKPDHRLTLAPDKKF